MPGSHAEWIYSRPVLQRQALLHEPLGREAMNPNSLILNLCLTWCKGGAVSQRAQGVKPALKLTCMSPGLPPPVPSPEH